jgi:hypothetical protein
MKMMRMSNVRIGHINLARTLNGTGEHFISLVEGLQQRDVRQYVLVRNRALAKRLQAVGDVEVGPTVKSAVSAYCLMPRCDLVHIHDTQSAQAGLLLTLTRSIPFVMTQGETLPGTGPIVRAVYKRAARIICRDASDAALLRHCEPSLNIAIVPDVVHAGSASRLLRVYQNSQRIPTAGSNGIQ